MFDNNRYITSSVKKEIPIDLQLFIWNCIDELKKKEIELDYLQVFEFSRVIIDDIELQLVEHRQQVPEYKEEYKMFPTQIVDAKLFLIDDGENSTLMMANEY